MSLLLLLLLSLLLKGSVTQIIAHGDTTVVYGGDAHYRCTAVGLTGVRQVTWQRLFTDDSMENLATYSGRFGQQVNEPYRGKVAFSEAALNATAITLRRATFEDEACYVCSFNAFPDGSEAKETCLTVMGLSSEVNASFSVRPLNRSQEVAFRCSVSGKPAPVLTWAFSPGVAASGPAHSATELRPDGSATTRSDVAVTVSQKSWDGYADCQVNRGMEGERTERIHVSLKEEKEEEKEAEEGNLNSKSHLGFILGVPALILLLIAGVTGVVLKTRSSHRREPADSQKSILHLVRFM